MPCRSPTGVGQGDHDAASARARGRDARWNVVAVRAGQRDPAEAVQRRGGGDDEHVGLLRSSEPLVAVPPQARGSSLRHRVVPGVQVLAANDDADGHLLRGIVQVTDSLTLAMAFYITTPIYYVNAAPHLGPRVHDDRADVLARHHRQRGEDVFFLTGTDEHGEPVALAAEREGVAPQELPTATPSASGRSCRGSTPPTTSSSARATRGTRRASRRSSSASTTTGTSTRAPTRAGTARAARTSRRRTRSGRTTRCPIHHIQLTREQEENWFFRLSRLPGAARAALRRAARLRAARATRYNEALRVHHAAGSRTSRSRARSSPGASPVPWDPSHVFYVWFDALLNYYTALGFARDGRGPDRALLAGDVPPHRQGHPEVPHGLLARAAAGRRAAAARARLRPRLPADGRREDEQVAGQRARPVRDHRPLRHRRAALLLPARRLLRPGRLGLDGGFEAALRDRAGQRAGQPRQPHDRDARALPRRRGPGGRARRRARRRLRRPARAGRALLDRAELTAGARGASGARAAAEPLRRGAGAVELAKDPERAPSDARRACSRTLAEGLRVVDRAAARRGCRRRRRSCSTRSARPRPRLRRRRASARGDGRGDASARSSRCSRNAADR